MGSMAWRPWVCWMLCCGSGVSASAAEVHAVTFPIPVHVESETRGVFIDLVKAVAKEAGLTVDIAVVPPLRAHYEFRLGQRDVLFPALDIDYSPGATIVRSSETIDCKEDFVFTKRGTPLLRTLADLKGMRVGITRGYPYERSLMNATGLDLEAADSDEVNIRKLIAGHIDAFVLDEKTGLQAFKDLGLTDRMQYDRTHPLSQMDVYYAFQNTPAGKELAQRFSQALFRLKQDGRYPRITRGITIGGGCPKH